jgi:hypothetical protein
MYFAAASLLVTLVSGSAYPAFAGTTIGEFAICGLDPSPTTSARQQRHFDRQLRRAAAARPSATEQTEFCHLSGAP